MSASNITQAMFGGFRACRTAGLYQWDYGQVLKFADLTLPAAYEVHFSNVAVGGDSVTQIGGADGVAIPDAMLTSGKPVFAWVYLHTGEDDGETEYAVTIPVTARPKPTNGTPTPVQQDAITEAIAALNAGVDAAEAARDAIEDMGVTAETLEAGSSATVEKSVDPDTGAVTLGFGIPRGETGLRGPTGVYVGTETPSASEEVNVWIDPEGRPSIDYVTPEMYGAAGDGETNDRDAVFRALNTGKCVVFSGQYMIGSGMQFSGKTLEMRGIGGAGLIFNATGDLFDLTNCRVKCDGMAFSGTSTGHVFSSTGTEYKLFRCNVTGAMNVIKQESGGSSRLVNEFSDCDIDTTGNGIRYYGNASSDCVIRNCRIKAANYPYFVVNCLYAHVIGGEFSSVDETGACNLYSNQFANIDGGYYHDMLRGATVGGRAGKCCSVIGTKNKGTTFSGISVDLATGQTDPYTEGKVIVMGNLVETSGYGIYLQGRRMIVSGNNVYCANSGNDPIYGIRLNCDDGLDADYGSIISDNLIDCSNNAKTYPVYLAAHTLATIRNNRYVNCAQKVAGEATANIISEAVLHFSEADYSSYDSIVISENYGVYVCDQLAQARYIYVPTWNSNLTPIGKAFTIVNMSSYNLTVNTKNSTTTTILKTGSSAAIPTNGIGKLICIGAGKWILDIATFS